MPEIICKDCGKKLFHENEDTLKIQENVHKKFCRKKEGQAYSYMHRDPSHPDPLDSERENDAKGNPILKK
ncbi:MAG: hypothetical protein GWN01_02135 [Nitrosopumilaceae archaeon]|nr:hypothetical protein [Nitrosopumilaceae archaeon]NIT99773.1 hypothetical protein [Nitrosopumilaceae archaeon]NIU88635.1 hypothetical protein [Nitrosopumilaceae archaeon]NIV64909.1 hypothetical protein [Nitrosopumilaceae archaeon]NIX60376.1 hypothetical protein [Nitrosopumilaceae archaeon]